MVFLEYRHSGEIYLYVTQKEDLQKCILWLTKELAKMEKYGKNATTIMHFEDKKDE